MFKKITAGCLIAIFVPLFMILIFGFTAKKTILNPNFYKNQFSKEEVYTKLISHGLSFMTSGMMESDTPMIGSDTLAITVQSILKPEWVKERMNTFFDGLSNYLSGKTDILEGKISFKEIKEKLTGSLESQVSKSMDNLPECTEKQMKQFDIESGKDMKNLKLDCIPPGKMTSEFKDSFKKLSSGSFILEAIPNEINLRDSFEKNQKELNLLKKIYSYISIGLYILLAIDIITLIIIGFLIYKPISSILKWLATALIIPSGLIFIVALVGLFSSSIIIKNFILPPETTIQIASLIVDILQNFIKEFLNYLLIFSSIPLIIAIGLYIWAYFQKKKEP